MLDASVTLSWFIDTPVPAYAMKVRQALESGVGAIVPAIWHLEIANALAVSERRGILTADDVALSLVQIEHLLTQDIESDNTFISAKQALTVARSFQLSAYDGVYLQTALNEGLPLATLDRALRSAAEKSGVKLF
ncbi:MAG TPA: type II toxin-antitoxin system VapC family toxin [Terriglobales bacterium]|nr:type II toxin-antitoxin system VapC family toxin [Terriglobales bacterium]